MQVPEPRLSDPDCREDGDWASDGAPAFPAQHAFTESSHCEHPPATPCTEIRHTRPPIRQPVVAYSAPVTPACTKPRGFDVPPASPGRFADPADVARALRQLGVAPRAYGCTSDLVQRRTGCARHPPTDDRSARASDADVPRHSRAPSVGQLTLGTSNSGKVPLDRRPLSWAVSGELPPPSAAAAARRATADASAPGVALHAAGGIAVREPRPLPSAHGLPRSSSTSQCVDVFKISDASAAAILRAVSRPAALLQHTASTPVTPTGALKPDAPGNAGTPEGVQHTPKTIGAHFKPPPLSPVPTDGHSQPRRRVSRWLELSEHMDLELAPVQIDFLASPTGLAGA